MAWQLIRDGEAIGTYDTKRDAYREAVDIGWRCSCGRLTPGVEIKQAKERGDE